MSLNPSATMTLEVFQHREHKRRTLFGEIWSVAIPDVFRDVPRYYRLGNIVASMGLWELWASQFVGLIDVVQGGKVLDVCAGTNDVGIRLLRRRPDLAVTAIDRSREMQEEGQRRARKYGVRIDNLIDDAYRQLRAAERFLARSDLNDASVAVERLSQATQTLRDHLRLVLPQLAAEALATVTTLRRPEGA